MTAPVRVQLSRAKGWRMPENTVKVDRTTRLGNPFIVNAHVKAGSKSGAQFICLPTVEDAVECFRLMLEEDGPTADAYRAMLPELRGKNLACWCKIGSPCHAEVSPRAREQMNGQDLGPNTEARFTAVFSTRAVVDKRTAADLIGLDVKTLDALSDAKVIRAVRKGAHRAYTERDLRLYLIEGPDIACGAASQPGTPPKPKTREKAPPHLRVVNFSEIVGNRR